MTINVPRMLHWRRDARNGHAPAAQFYSRAVESVNYLTAYGGREVFGRSWDLGQAAPSVITTRARFYFRSKHGANRLTFVVVMAPAGFGAEVLSPYVEIDVETGGVTTTLSSINYGSTSANFTDAPNGWLITDRHATITGVTDYRCTVRTANYAHLVSIVAYEQTDLTVSEGVEFYSGLAPAAGVAIYDAHRDRLLRGLSEMYRHNGGTLIHWGKPDGSAQTRSPATLASLYDGTTTGTPATTAAGFYINNFFHHTSSRTTVPYEMAVYASASGTVRLTGADGVDYITVTTSGAAGWFTATGNLPNTDAFYSLRFNGNGFEPVSVYAVSIMEWES